MPPNPNFPQQWSARIRMYKQGLGDCFLLTFNTTQGLRHMLIDCGVLQGTPGGSEKIRSVAANIDAETKGELDVLIATHEHWDHVSGFLDAKKTFDPMKMREIWVAWTEDPNQKILKERKKKKLAALQLALGKISDLAEEEQRRGGAIADVLGFFGGLTGLIGFSVRTEEAMNKVTKRDPVPEYCEPGKVIEKDWLPGVRIYVLAPPKSIEDIKYNEQESDMYGLAGPDYAFVTALEAMHLDEQGEEDVDPVFLPFDRNLQWVDRERLATEWPSLFGPYNSSDDSWRRIDHDWLYSAARLALQLDDHQNNTSLVLAIELIESKNVLLFVGDAEIGNWRSWDKVKWKITDNGQEKTIKAEDLLKKITFYKVGHHGSHNATLKEKGLERMTSSSLVAAIPVDEEFAHQPKGKNKNGWDMPAGPLKTRLLEKTKGRLIRADWQNIPAASEKPDNITSKQWTKFVKSLRMDPGKLFIDYFL